MGKKETEANEAVKSKNRSCEAGRVKKG